MCAAARHGRLSISFKLGIFIIYKRTSMINRRSFAHAIAAWLPALAGLGSIAQSQQAKAPATPPPGRGPMDGSPVGDQLPGQKWRVHDHSRPQPAKVTPGQPIPTPSAPSDAIVLFDGKDLSKWSGRARGGAVSEPGWKVVDGHIELVPGKGSLVTKDSFGDVQLHLEW